MSSRLALAMSASALVVALLGSTPLGHAIASQVPRSSVGPLQLKRNAVGPQKLAPNAVRAGHVLNGSLLAADFRPGQLPAGPKGDKGEKGDKGDPGLAGLSAREVVVATSPINSDTHRRVEATCPADKVAIGGGGVAVPVFFGVFPVAVTETSPSGQRGWTAAAQEVDAYGSNWWIQAQVVCARVS